MNISSIQNILIFFTISLYLILNVGFMQLRIFPGIPIGELVLIFVLFTTNLKSYYPKFISAINPTPFILWWLYGGVYLIFSFYYFGIWALRDGSQIIESLFILVGFIFASNFIFFSRFVKYLPYILIFAFIHSLTFHNKDFLISIMPKIQTANGAEISILFNYLNSALLSLMLISYIFIFKNKNHIYYFLISFFILLYVLVTYHARIIYFQLFALAILFYFFNTKASFKLFFSCILCLLSLFVIEKFNINISGRMGNNTTVDFIANHALSSFGIKSEGLEAPVSGFYLRFFWIKDVLIQLKSNFWNFVFGLGYGTPLIDYVATPGVVVREPHNSYLSIFARGGIFGLFLWSWMHFLMVTLWFKVYCFYKEKKSYYYQNLLLLFFVYFVLIWILALAQDAFEKPANIIPYYFFWGIIIRLAYNQVNPRSL
jgi:hypothetical protein